MLIVLNHASLLDVPALMVLDPFPNTRTIVKASLFKLPIISWFLKQWGAIAVERHGRAVGREGRDADARPAREDERAAALAQHRHADRHDLADDLRMRAEVLLDLALHLGRVDAADRIDVVRPRRGVDQMRLGEELRELRRPEVADRDRRQHLAAFQRVFFTQPDCFPGVTAALELP